MDQNFFNYYLDKVDSTNIKIKKISEQKSYEENIALLAYNQTSGRGRSKNYWISNYGDLTCSFLIKKKIEVDKLGQINILISVAIIEALKKIFPNLIIKIKWPNDLYVENKKIGGILLESQINKNLVNYLIIGLGINIVTSPIIEKYETTKISNYTENTDLKKIFHLVRDHIYKNICIWDKKNFKFFKTKWISFSKDVGGTVSIKKNNNFYTGNFMTISENGELVMNTKEKKTISFSFGEIV